jgi:excisionase family DNA binding protein
MPGITLPATLTNGITLSPKQAPEHVAPLAVSAEKLAKMLDVSERSIRTLTKDGKLPFVRLGNRIVYPIESIREFLTENAKKEPRQSPSLPGSQKAT